MAAASSDGDLAPSGVRKGGAGLDLPIAVGLLLAAGELSPGCTEGLSFCGELGLNGALRHVPGMIALADAAAPAAAWSFPSATSARRHWSAGPRCEVRPP